MLADHEFKRLHQLELGQESPVDSITTPQTAVIVIAVFAGCSPNVGAPQAGSESSGSDSTTGSDPRTTSSTSSDTSTGEATEATETASEAEGSTSAGGQPTLPEQAASLACAALQTVDATEIPDEAGAGFRFGEYPARFRVNITEAPSPLLDGEMWCHHLTAECAGCPKPLPGRFWQDEDGEYRVHMVTRGIDHIEFYGTDEPLNGEMYAPLVPSIQYDVADQCPELPQAWTPDPAQGPYGPAPIICMRHSEDIAEVVFVRVPE